MSHARRGITEDNKNKKTSTGGGGPPFHCATSSSDPNNSLIMILTGHKTQSSCGSLFCTVLESQPEMGISDIMEPGSRGLSHHHQLSDHLKKC